MLKPRLSGALCAAAALLLSAAGSAADSASAAGPPSSSASPSPTASRSPSHSGVQNAAARLDAYWTPARLLAAAGPADGTAPESPGHASTTAASAAPGSGPGYDGPLPGEYIPPSHPFTGVPQVGTFFWTDASGSGRTCSGSVVHSPGGDLVLSAGHCLEGFAGPSPARSLAFVPRYHDGLKPFGVFPVRADGVYVSRRYYTLGRDAGAEYDFGFVRTLPDQRGRSLERALGTPGYTLLTGTGYVHAPVRMIGYPGGRPEPIECLSYSAPWRSTDPADPGVYPRVPCADFIDGTSGGPMTVALPHSPSGTGVFGVVGGLHTGGDTPSVSYSATFGAATRALYDQAVAGAPPARP
ncbi:trypsin-like serine peptidase [Phaeacidiphilus oryzae]|uniref:trypsin-like serine peptidase n=1 Tax=Phaeacidiphilus oryzae TaxID=348818 RepID=UPI0006911AA5|nr:hypothetical protein [Phaeacidiphilus oryzae]